MTRYFIISEDEEIRRESEKFYGIDRARIDAAFITGVHALSDVTLCFRIQNELRNRLYAPVESPRGISDEDRRYWNFGNIYNNSLPDLTVIKGRNRLFGED